MQQQFSRSLTKCKSSPNIIPEKPRQLARTQSYAGRSLDKLGCESYLISDNSRDISDVVSYVPVLDRLTCEYLVPEAEKIMIKSKSMDLLHLVGNTVEKLEFDSSALSEMLPNTMSYADLSRFMSSPQYHVRIRGQTPSFEKILNEFKKSLKNSSCVHAPIDLTDFFKRDAELIQLREEIANPSPPEIRLNASPRSQKLALKSLERRNSIDLQRSQEEFQTIQKSIRQEQPEYKKKVQAKHAVFAQKTETSIKIFNLRQETYVKVAKNAQEKENKKQSTQIHASPKNKKLAKRSEERYQKRMQALKEARAKREAENYADHLEECNFTQKHAHKTPSYMSNTLSFMKEKDVHIRTPPSSPKTPQRSPQEKKSPI